MNTRIEITTEILDDDGRYTLREVCECSDVSAEDVLGLVAEGIANPQGREPQQWRFTGIHLLRIRRAVRLQRDLGINRPGAVLAVELLEELDRLRGRRSGQE